MGVALVKGYFYLTDDDDVELILAVVALIFGWFATTMVLPPSELIICGLLETKSGRDEEF